MKSKTASREQLLAELFSVVERLRRRCPWDRKQTVASTRPLMLNETYELDDSLRSGERHDIVEELGDYVFMGVFLADVLRKERGIKLEESLRRIIAKLKFRHPHIYGKVKVRNAEEVLANWDKLKAKEKQRSILAGVPVAMPALHQSQLIQERCRRVGFDWEDPRQVLDKVAEEVEELRVELRRPRRSKARVSEELGDLLFALVNLARHLGVDAEGTLKDANIKFRSRFRHIEDKFSRDGRALTDVSLEDMEAVWQQAKRLPRRSHAKRANRR
jgi:MazG family protein